MMVLKLLEEYNKNNEKKFVFIENYREDNF